MQKHGWVSLTKLWQINGIDLTSDANIEKALDDHPGLQPCASDKSGRDQRTGVPNGKQNPCFQKECVTRTGKHDRSIGRKRLWLQSWDKLSIGAKYHKGYPE